VIVLPVTDHDLSPFAPPFNVCSLHFHFPLQFFCLSWKPSLDTHTHIHLQTHTHSSSLTHSLSHAHTQTHTHYPEEQ